MIFKCIIACLRRLLCKLNFLAYLCGIRDSLKNFQNLVTNLDFDFSVLYFCPQVKIFFFSGAEIFLFLVESKFQAFTNQFLTIYLVGYDLSIFLK